MYSIQLSPSKYCSSWSSFSTVVFSSTFCFFLIITFSMSFLPLGFSLWAWLLFFSCSCCFFSSSFLFSSCFFWMFYCFCLFLISFSISGIKWGYSYFCWFIISLIFSISLSISVICLFIYASFFICYIYCALFGFTCWYKLYILTLTLSISRFSLSNMLILLLFAFLSSLILWHSSAFLAQFFYNAEILSWLSAKTCWKEASSSLSYIVTVSN